jgi:uncharacterized membrane protein
MTIENINTQITFTQPEKDGGAMQNCVQTVYNLTLEIQSAQEAIKDAIAKGFDVYKEKIDSDSKKGDYSAFVKNTVSEMTDGKVSENITKLENVIDQIEIAKKYVK